MVSSAAMLLVSIVELVIIQKRKGVGNRLKWVIGIGFIVSAILTTSTVGPVGSILFVLLEEGVCYDQ